MNIKEILTEWRIFINESIKEKFQKSDIGKKVKIVTSCDKCGEFTGKDKGIELKDDWSLKYVNFGTTAIDDNEHEILVKIESENKEIVVPQCCVRKLNKSKRSK